jgi:hypothetical protein
VSWVGNATNAATVGHGLSVSPEMVILKNRDRTSNWHVGGNGVGTVNQYLDLNTNAAIDSASTGFQGFTSTVFQLGTDTDWNANSEDLIAYCFHSVDGYSKVGSFIGNGNVDGAFVHCGFKPAFLLFRRSTETGSWFMFDNARGTTYNVTGTNFYNVRDNKLNAEGNYAEDADSSWNIDFLSNGFKLRSSHVYMNSGSNTHIFLAFAENPFKHSNAH